MVYVSGRLVVMVQEDTDPDSPRYRLAEAAKSFKPDGRSRLDSKSRNAAEVADILRGLKRKYPKATATQLFRFCEEHGIATSLDRIRRVLAGKL